MDWGLIGGWLTAGAAVIAAVAQWIRNRGDKEVGVRSANRDDQAAWDARYQQVLDQVESHLLEPLREEVARLRSEVAELRSDLASERQALREERSRYRAALAHIRALTAWMGLHMPPGTPPPPAPPERITDDLH